MNRRTFFKSLGAISGCAVISPKIALKRIQYADFVPGKRYRHAIAKWYYESKAKSPSDVLRQRMDWDILGIVVLLGWLKEKIPENFIDKSKIVYRDKTFDWGHQIAKAIFYKSPLKPIK